MTTGSEVRHVGSVDEALQQLASLGSDGAPLAGGTWLMRAPHRSERPARCYVALRGARELRTVELGAEAAELGALATHAELAALDAPPALAGIVGAAARSAFPAVRSVATLGGNLCARGFAEADLVPALLAAGAIVRLRSTASERNLPVADLLAANGARPPDELVLGVSVPTGGERRSAYERLTIRGDGEYAVASVAVSVELVDGVVGSARVAVGSVEERARLCDAAAAALAGSLLDDDSAVDAGRAAADECTGRDGADAPGWYREAVLPALVRRAVARLQEGGS